MDLEMTLGPWGRERGREGRERGRGREGGRQGGREGKREGGGRGRVRHCTVPSQLYTLPVHMMSTAGSSSAPMCFKY